MTTENQAFIDNLLFNELIFFRENKEQKLRVIFENIVDFLVSSRNENGQVII